MELDTRKKLYSYLEREKIVSVLNDTKWQKLFDCLKTTDNYYLDFRRKDLNSSESPNWNGDLYEVFGMWQIIEWMEIRTDRAHLPELNLAVKNSGVPYSKNNDILKVWGYLRPGVSPNWV